MPSRYQRRLFEHLRHETYSPRRIEGLAEDLNVEDPADFADAVRELAERGDLDITDAGLVLLPSLGSTQGEIVGEFRGTQKGFAFIKPQRFYREGDVFVPPDHTLDALTGDTVRVALTRDHRRERSGGGGPQFVGRVVEVLKRKRSSFTGELTQRGAQWLVFPDGRELREPVVVRDAQAKNAKPGDKVVIEIVEYPQGGMLAEAVIVKVLGEAGRPDVETQAVIAAYNLPGEFPEACVEQARGAARRYEEEIAEYQSRGIAALPGRRDLTGDFILTIDPPDAKDYDDAISIRRTAQGWELGVHIADVAHFIDAGSPLDAEAKERGNSVYLPRHVIPMLPEVLSNGICSLQERVYRYCKSAFMAYDRGGNVRGEGVGSTLIKSAKRLTYLEAQALIDGDQTEAKKHAKTEPNYTDELLGALREMNELARAIEARRHRQGMITLELPDVVLIFDEHGHVVDAEREDDAFTHRLIEMFMVEANEVLARLFDDLDVPLLRRTHPEPTPGDVDELRRAAKVAGYTIPKNPSREELQALLDATRGTPASRAVHMAVLRTLTKAEYSPAPIGHFALASSAYAHFTSPIRRYADLTVHRSMAEYLRRTDNGQNRPQGDGEKKKLGRALRDTPACPSHEELVEIGKHITRTEVNAAEAENQLRSFLVLQLLSNQIGSEHDGVVTGVNQRGVFVQIDKYLADGFIKSDDLPADVTRGKTVALWRLDPRSGALVDQHSGRSYNMGDRVRVTVAAVDLAKRQMDLLITDAASRAAGKAKVPTLRLGQGGGGLGHVQGAAGDKFPPRTGSQKRSMRSKSRDQRKGDFRQDRKDKGKRQ